MGIFRTTAAKYGQEQVQKRSETGAESAAKPKRLRRLIRLFVHFVGSLARQLSPQPCLGKSQIVADNVNRQAERFSCFLGRHASEIPHFNQARQRFVFGSQGIDGAVQFDELHQLHPFVTGDFEVRGPQRIIFRAPGAFLGRSGSCVVDQNLPHHAGRDSEEMNLIGELSLLPVEELEIGFMNERGRLKRVIGTLAAEVPGSHAVQLSVEGGREFVQRRGISSVQPFKELRYLDVHETQTTTLEIALQIDLDVQNRSGFEPVIARHPKSNGGFSGNRP